MINKNAVSIVHKKQENDLVNQSSNSCSIS
jgi:hypothetical protein